MNSKQIVDNLGEDVLPTNLGAVSPPRLDGRSRLILFALAPAVLYWVTEAILINVVIFQQGTIAERILHPGSGYDLWHKVFTSVLFIGFSVFIQIMVKRERMMQADRFRLAAIVDSSRDAISSKSVDGIVTSWNTAAEELYGYSAAEMIGQPIWKLVPPENHAEESEILNRFRQRERVNRIDTVRLRKDGSRVDVSLTISPLTDEHGRVIGASGISRDITERNRIYRALARQAALLDLAHETIMVRTMDGTITFWNHGAEEMYGWQRDDVLGQQTHGLLQTQFPETGAKIDAELLARGRWEGELIHTVRDGEQIIVHSRQVLQRDDAGDPVAIMEINSDITERKKIELELHRSLEILDERTKALEETVREQEVFLYTVSHDLKAPLISMRGMVNILMEDHLSELDEDARLYVTRIAVNGEKMHTLINELLAFSRVGKVHNEQEWVDLNQVVAEVLDQLTHTMMERQAQIEIRSSLPVVSASRVRMGQLFLNLIDNAIKYTPQERSPQIQLAVQEQPGAWEITVQDNGIGIPHLYQDKIFGLFQRLPEATLLNPTGSGVGLTIVARVIETHGGELTVESEPGQGTTIRFTLPKRDLAVTEVSNYTQIGAGSTPEQGNRD